MNNRQPQGLRGEHPKKNVLVPRFFLLFPPLVVPYISRGSRQRFSRVPARPCMAVKVFSPFFPCECSLVSRELRQPQDWLAGKTDNESSGTHPCWAKIFSYFFPSQCSFISRGLHDREESLLASTARKGDGCMKDTDHCVRHRDVHQSNCASVRNEKKLSIAERSIWTRPGSVLGWSDPTFAHDSVAKVIRGSLQPKCSVRSVPRGEGEGETLTSSQRR